MRWKPIKTAPKDGSLVLLFGNYDNGDYMKTGFYNDSLQIGGYPYWRWA